MTPVSRRLVYAIAAMCCIILLSSRLRAGTDVAPEDIAKGSEDRRPDTHCARLFSASDSRLFWESSADSPGTCRSTTLDSASTRRCLERRLTASNRRAYIVFIGDSRARILFEKLINQLDLQWEGRTIRETFPSVSFSPNVTVKVLGEPKLCTAGHRIVFNPVRKLLLLACDASASNRLLRAQFFWRTHVDAGYLDTLSALAEQCGRGTDCPDVVVMTAGMWYAKPLGGARAVPLHERALRFRRDTAVLAERLQTLARHSKVVYKLDGPEMTEGHGTKSHIGGAIATVNAAAFGVMSQVWGAQVWTSSFFDSLRFFHSVCLPLRKHKAMDTNVVRYECLDENHVGDTVRLNAVHMLLSFVCRDSYVRLPGHCCGRTAE